MAEPQKLTAATLIPLGGVVALVALLVPAAWAWSERLASIEYGVRDLRSAAQRLERAMDAYPTTDRMLLWIEQLRRRNPTIDVPDLPK